MILDIALGSKAVWRILILLAGAPGKGVSRSELRNDTKLGNAPLSISLEHLKRFKLINEKKIGKSLYYNIDMTNEFAEDIIKIIGKERKKLNSLPYDFSLVIREFARKIFDIISPEKIILFGSVAKRTYRDDSDIDLAIVVEEINMDEKLRITEVIEQMEARFKRTVQAHYFTPEQFARKNDPLVMEVLKDGIEII